MERRLVLLPLIWAGFGIGEVVFLQYLLNPLASIIPATANDKPIAGALLPMLFGSTAMVLVVLGLSLYSLGYWEPKFAVTKTRVDLLVFAVLVVSGFLLFYTPFALFPLVLAGFYFLATNME